MHFLYRITNTMNSKIYIGQTVNPRSRWYAHQTEAARDKPRMIIASAIKKHGNHNFVFEVIAQCKTQDDANYLETELVKQYESHISTGKGYNATHGGMNAPKTEEWIKLIKEIRNRPENKEKFSKQSLALWDDPNYRQLMVEKSIERWSDPTYKQEVSKKIQQTKMNMTSEEKSDIYSRVSQTMLGVKHTEERKHNQSIAHLGKKTWNTGTKGIMKPNSGSFSPDKPAPNKGRKRVIDANGKVHYIKMESI